MKYQHICDDIYNRYVNGKQKRDLDDELDQDPSFEPCLKIPKLEQQAALPVGTTNISNLISEIEKMKTEISEQLSTGREPLATPQKLDENELSHECVEAPKIEAPEVATPTMFSGRP